MFESAQSLEYNAAVLCFSIQQLGEISYLSYQYFYNSFRSEWVRVLSHSELQETAVALQLSETVGTSMNLFTSCFSQENLLILWSWGHSWLEKQAFFNDVLENFPVVFVVTKPHIQSQNMISSVSDSAIFVPYPNQTFNQNVRKCKERRF